MRRWLEDPLAGFVAAASGAFLLFAAWGGDTSDPAREITITAADVEGLKESFELVWLREPTEEEIRGLIEERVRDEILYREAVAMGLDRDDTVVRRRLRQGLEIVASEVGAVPEPNEEELEDFLRAHPERYRREPTVSFRQIYLSPERRSAAIESDAAKLLEVLRARGESMALDEMGDPTLLPGEEVDVRLSQLAARFGQDFAEALARSPRGEWVGPIGSPYGVHLVLVVHRDEGGIPRLHEVRDAVLRDWKHARSGEAEAEFFTSLLERYTIIVESEELGSR